MHPYRIFTFCSLIFLLACTASKEASTPPLSLSEIVPDHATVDKLVDGYNFLEGPIWDQENDRLIFSEVGGNTLHQWTEEEGISTFLTPSYYAGGNVFDKEGNIISCQGGARQLARISPDKKVEILTSSWEGKKFNSPNDAVVKRDGTIWFTDPDYGLLAAYGEKAAEFREIDKYHIFVFDPISKTTRSVFSELSKPNGLVFSKDEQRLYVGNSKEGDRKLLSFEVTADNGLSNRQVLANIESKTWGIDGLKMDYAGNLYAACGDGVNIFSPQGALIGKIDTDFEVTNLCFGGPDKQTLFLTGHEALYRIHLKVKGK
ncbi:MAG: SMP-30/gluconolactonase/LRE family protein [Saprospiraceae bacterium]|nr:SMP-30/gluconolactonase/LRE family protein [Saprospiraceae bacterium]